MQEGVGLVVSDMMPIYMIIPRYSHNYAQFCQLLNNNLFTHRRILMLLREATSETYGPRVSFSSYQSPSLYYCFAFTLLSFYLLCISLPKIPKILFIISIRSHFHKWPWRDGQPLSALVALSYCFCVGTRDSRVASYWIDTLVLKNWGKYLRYFAASSSPLRGNPTQCSRGSKKNFWRRCRGGSRNQVNNTKYPSQSLSLALHYLPFASRFPLPHFTLAVLFALSLYPPSLFLFASFFPLAFYLLVC